MGSVYEVRHTRIGRKLALKALHKRFAENPEMVERFVRELVVPNEQTYREQLAGTDDWTRWKIPPIVEEPLEGRVAGQLGLAEEPG